MHEVKQVIDRSQSDMKLIAFPVVLGERVQQFLLDKGHGNITLNVQDGQIMKVVIEQHFKR